MAREKDQPRKGRKPPPRPPDERARSARPRMSHRMLGLMLLALAIAIGAVIITIVRRSGSLAGEDRITLPPPSGSPADTDAISSSDFIGSEACAECHQAAFTSWTRSTHAAAGGTPGRVNVVPSFDGTPIRFRDAVVVPQRRGSSYSFTVRQRGRAERVFRVDGIIGGGHMEGGGTQGFVSRFPDGTLRFLPFDFARREGVWFCNTTSRANRGWVPITADIDLADCGDWPPARILGDETRFTNCQSCHGSQIAVTLDSTTQQYRTSFTSLGISCESCHGPARAHVSRARDPQAIAAGDLRMRTLATLDKDGSLGVCWQCHSLKDQLQPGYIAGMNLQQYYSTLLPQLGEEAHYPDGRVRTFAYQGGHRYSACYVAGGMTCTSCHDPHSQKYRDVQGRPLSGRSDDRQCTSCHASKSVDPTAHTRHAAGSAGSRCVACHMPYLQEPATGNAIRYARSDHAIPIPRPLADSALGVRSACILCHSNRSEAALDAQVTAWYGALKPRDDAIAEVIAGSEESDPGVAAGRLLLPGAAHTAAVFAGLARFSDRHLAPDMTSLPGDAETRLRQLAEHADIDVRSLALASLHLARGESPGVRRFLAERLRVAGPDERLLRARWAVALGYFADKLRANGNPQAGATTYGKAADIDPANHRVQLNLALALAQAGQNGEAVTAYRRSLELDPGQPLAHVNLGIALAAQGDRAGAVREYQRALSLNRHEPLAHFNLANVHMETGNLDSAAAGYQRTIDNDPSLSLPRFLLARILAQRGELARALQEVDAGLEFDPENAEALSAKLQLTRALGGAR